MGSLNPYAKAVISGLIAGATAFAAAAAQGGITLEEWGWVVVAALGGFLGVWATPNTPAPARHAAGLYGTPAATRTDQRWLPYTDAPPSTTTTFEAA